MTLGETIKNRRTQLNLSQAELGKRIGSNDSCVSRVERTSKAKFEVLTAIASALDSNIVELLVSAGYGGQPHSDESIVVPSCDMKYLSEEDQTYIKTFIEALVEKRKRERGEL